MNQSQQQITTTDEPASSLSSPQSPSSKSSLIAQKLEHIQHAQKLQQAQRQLQKADEEQQQKHEQQQQQQHEAEDDDHQVEQQTRYSKRQQEKKAIIIVDEHHPMKKIKKAKLFTKATTIDASKVMMMMSMDEEEDDVTTPTTATTITSPTLTMTTSISSLQEEEEELQLAAAAEDISATTTHLSPYQKFKKFLSSQIFAHMLLFLVQIIFGGFCVLGPTAVKAINAMVFSCLRIGIMAVTLFPLAWIFDRDFSFHSKDVATMPMASSQSGDEQSVQEMEHEEPVLVKEKNTLQRIKYHVTGLIPGRSDALLLAACGIMLYVSVAAYTAAVAFISTTIIGILSPLSTVFTCVMSVALKREPKSAMKFIGVTLAVIGSMSMLVITSLVGGKSSDSTQDGKKLFGMNLDMKSLAGILLMMLNGFTWATYLVLQKSILNRGIPPFTQSSWAMLSAFISSCICSAYFFVGFDPRKLHSIEIIGLLYASLAFGTLNYGLNAFAARIITPTMLSVYSCCAPMVSAASLYLFYGETTTWYAVIGVAFITTGVMLVAISKGREARMTQKAPMDEKVEAETIPKELEMMDSTERDVEQDLDQKEELNSVKLE